MSVRERLGWHPFFEAQIAGVDRGDLCFSRVIEEQRGLYRLAGDVEAWAEVSGRFRHDATSAADFPAVGDWVGAVVSEEHGGRRAAADRAIIHVRLERRSTVSRAAAGRAADQQVVAANVDTIFLVTAFARDLSPRRLERYLTMVWDAGAVPVVVLNKADLCQDPAAAGQSLAARLPLVDVLIVSALHEHGLTALEPYLHPARTVALLGSSGVGKSTLVNRLLGREMLKVRAISDSDGKGRHTTTSRQLVELPGGALLIDTPGMRELQPWVDESAVDAAFDDIAALAGACRFADCAHATEPGCAVLASVAAGRLDADRLENYRRLGREAAFEERKRDKAAAANTKRRWKQIIQAQKALYKDRGRW
ncbi:MAG: ribosome small subunit-dependent GTPase A [Acidobacteria bacterium]|nr:MAG: ribosome small subunit-dependent GTPase A [Acidobacteriota bacterium]